MKNSMDVHPGVDKNIIGVRIIFWLASMFCLICNDYVKSKTGCLGVDEKHSYLWTSRNMRQVSPVKISPHLSNPLNYCMQIVRVIETRKNTLLTVHLSCSSPSRNDEITTSADSSSKKTSCIHKDGQDFSKRWRCSALLDDGRKCCMNYQRTGGEGYIHISYLLISLISPMSLKYITITHAQLGHTKIWKQNCQL